MKILSYCVPKSLVSKLFLIPVETILSWQGHFVRIVNEGAEIQNMFDEPDFPYVVWSAKYNKRCIVLQYMVKKYSTDILDSKGWEFKKFLMENKIDLDDYCETLFKMQKRNSLQEFFGDVNSKANCRANQESLRVQTELSKTQAELGLTKVELELNKLLSKITAYKRDLLSGSIVGNYDDIVKGNNKLLKSIEKLSEYFNKI